MTISISSEPSPTARRVSSNFVFNGYWPLGKPVATEATFTGESVPRNVAHTDHIRIHTNRSARRHIISSFRRLQRFATQIGNFTGYPFLSEWSIHHGDRHFQPGSFELVLMLRLANAAAVPLPSPGQRSAVRESEKTIRQRETRRVWPLSKAPELSYSI